MQDDTNEEPTAARPLHQTYDVRIANARGHLRNAMESTDTARALIDAAEAVITEQAPVLAYAIDQEHECFEHLKALADDEAVMSGDTPTVTTIDDMTRDSLWARLCAVEATRVHRGAASLGFSPLLACIKLTGLFGPEFNGRLLALVREAHGDPGLFVVSDLHDRRGERIWYVRGGERIWYLSTTGESVCRYYTTESEALVAALEVAP